MKVIRRKLNLSSRYYFDDMTLHETRFDGRLKCMNWVKEFNLDYKFYCIQS